MVLFGGYVFFFIVDYGYYIQMNLCLFLRDGLYFWVVYNLCYGLLGFVQLKMYD